MNKYARMNTRIILFARNLFATSSTAAMTPARILFSHTPFLDGQLGLLFQLIINTSRKHTKTSQLATSRTTVSLLLFY